MQLTGTATKTHQGKQINMNLFICNTPLHILISLLVCRENPKTRSIFVVIEDSPGIHQLSLQLIPQTFNEIYLLPGLYKNNTAFKSTATLISNVKFLLSKFGNFSGTLYCFHDIRAEPQSLLNHYKNKSNVSAILLEDGIALYEPRSLLKWSIKSIIQHKISAGLKWKKYNEIGLHPCIKGIRSFYPELLRNNIKHKQSSPIPFDISPINLNSINEDWTNKFTSPSALITVPHTGFVKTELLNEFLQLANKHCTKSNLAPLFKTHPRDKNGVQVIRNFFKNPTILNQALPAELIAAKLQNLHSVIGTKTSSLHIIKRLFPESRVFYLESCKHKEECNWTSFYKNIGIFPLETE